MSRSITTNKIEKIGVTEIVFNDIMKNPKCKLRNFNLLFNFLNEQRYFTIEYNNKNTKNTKTIIILNKLELLIY